MTPMTPPESLAQSTHDDASSVASSSATRAWRFATECATVENPSPALRDQHGSSSVPIYQTATFKGMDGQFDYTRSGNPTRSFLEHHLKKLSSAASAHVVSSGMAALDLILRLVKPGDTVLAGDDLYGGTNRLLGWLGTDGGVTVHHCNTSDPEALLPYLGEGNKVSMVLLESPTNPMLKIADIRALVAVIRAGAPDALIVADNTMMSPYLQRPLDLGCDISYDSGTKFLSGHHDLMAGAVTARTPEVGARLSWFTNAMGTALAPFDCFLLLRGLKTLPLRMDKQQASCEVLARYLDALGFAVHYPGLTSDPGHAVHFSQSTGAGAVMSFETGDVALSEGIVGGTRLFGISVSFGAVNSLISMPCLMSHASIPAHLRAERGLPEHLIRLCVGIEDVNDLLDDLETSLISSGAIRHRFQDKSQHSSGLETPTSERSLQDGGWEVERARGFERVPLGGGAGAAPIGGAAASSSGAGGPPTPEDVERALEAAAKEEAPLVDGESLDHAREDILVSAPGKVILFGEHAVVHGVTGIAASVDLRCYGALSSKSTPLTPTTVSLSLPDLGFTHSWPASSLPWDLAPALTSSSSASSPATAPKDLNPQLLAAVEALAQETQSSEREQVSIAAFLYLVLALGKGQESLPLHFSARSALPMGAGLGSSAAYSTCIAAALLTHHNLLPPISSSSPENARLDLLDGWAFVAEKVIHGNPSGIDNAVSVRGGAVAFRRRIEGVQEGGMEGMKGFASVRFLITDSRVGRDTKSLVAGVSARLASSPQTIRPLLDAIQTIASTAQDLLSSSSPLPRAELVQKLEVLVRENHARLRDLGVSHEVLERIVGITSGDAYALSTKLTGAGGGGCAVTLVPDYIAPDALASLQQALKAEGFAPYMTAVGGPGVGILASPSPSSASGALRQALEKEKLENLASWADSRGTWVLA